jgi:hypothetical protein
MLDNGYTVLYPWREYAQIEVAASDYYRMFGEYPIRRTSGDIAPAKKIRVFCTAVEIPVIVAKPHVHLCNTDPSRLEYLNFPFELALKYNDTTDGLSHIHLDTDQYAAIQGI